MKEHTQQLLDKSLDVLEAAEVLLQNGKVDVAAGRAYYSMMHTAEALLFEDKDLSFNKHGDIHAAYGHYFAKTKVLNRSFTVGYWMLSISGSWEITM